MKLLWKVQAQVNQSVRQLTMKRAGVLTGIVVCGLDVVARCLAFAWRRSTDLWIGPGGFRGFRCVYLFRVYPVIRSHNESASFLQCDVEHTLGLCPQTNRSMIQHERSRTRLPTRLPLTHLSVFKFRFMHQRPAFKRVCVACKSPPSKLSYTPITNRFSMRLTTISPWSSNYSVRFSSANNISLDRNYYQSNDIDQYTYLRLTSFCALF